MLIDDDEDEYLLAQEALRHAGSSYQLDWSGSYEEGCRAIERGEHELFLIDYSLGERTGIELLEHARRIGTTAALIMLTGHTEASIDTESMHAGADDYLVKRELSGTTFERAIRYGIERARNREIRRRERELFDRFMDNLPAIAFVRDSKHRYLFANAALAANRQLSPDEIVGRSLFELLPEESARALSAIDCEVLESKTVLRRAVEFRHGKEDEHHFEIIAFPLRGSTGEPLVGGIAVEITENVRMQNRLREAHDLLERRVEERTVELQEAIAQLNAAYEAQRRFVADASHDLRSPLTVMRTEIELIGKAPSAPESMRESLTRLARASERMQALASDLLVLATVDSGSEAHNKAPVALDQLLIECVGELESLAREKALQWHIEVNESFDVEGDATALRRALANVLQNAIRYARDEGSITVRLDKRDGDALIEIADDGVGIAADDLPNVFDRFFRGDRTRSTPGTGLGLAIVKGVVEAHQGTVSIRSTEGEVTTVSIVLPL